MKIRSWFAALALALALPAALHAQNRDERMGGGYMGIYFGWEDGDTSAQVREVIAGSPADHAGIHVGDTVLRINGRAATRAVVDELRVRLESGDTVRLSTRRDGQVAERLVVATARPSRVVYGPSRGSGRVMVPGQGEVIIQLDTLDEHVDSLLTHMNRIRTRVRNIRGDSVWVRVDSSMRIMNRALDRVWPSVTAEVQHGGTFVYDFGGRAVAGAEFAEMNPGLSRYFHTDRGLLVVQVADSAPAGRSGLQPGDVVQDANGNRISSVRELREVFARANGEEVRLGVLREGRRQELQVRWQLGGLWRVAPSRARAETERARAEAVRARSRAEGSKPAPAPRRRSPN